MSLLGGGRLGVGPLAAPTPADAPDHVLEPLDRAGLRLLGVVDGVGPAPARARTGLLLLAGVVVARSAAACDEPKLKGKKGGGERGVSGMKD